MTTGIPSNAYLEASRGPEIIRSTAAVAVLATLAVIGRLISRNLQKKQYNASDYTICFGLIGCWGITAIVIASELFFVDFLVLILTMISTSIINHVLMR